MFAGLINTLVDIIYPKACILCKDRLKGNPSVDDITCLRCWSEIKKNIPPFCHHCGKHLDRPVKNICHSCIRQPKHFDRAFSPCVYDGAVKELIHEFKYKNKDYLGKTLSALMIEFINEYSIAIDAMDFIVPVPLHKARMREREFNQAAVLSQNIAGNFNKDVLDNCLVRTRHTRRQTDLDPAERLLNVKDSFSVPDKDLVKNKNILLVDDVLTTGATSSEAALALKKAGARVVFVLTLAN